MFAVETDTGTWIAAGISAGGVLVPVLIYIFTRGRKRLEYVVVTNAALLPGRVAADFNLEVTRNNEVVANPALTITRLVNTGNQPIRPEDYSTGLTATFEDAEDIVSAAWSARRPSDIPADIKLVGGNRMEMAAVLLNPGDMLELQVLTAGRPSAVKLGGRVAGLTIGQRKALPYPPGSGREGEMVGLDKFMWFVLPPGFLIGAGYALATSEDTTTLGKLLTGLATAIVLGVYLLHIAYLVRRRRRWRPC